MDGQKPAKSNIPPLHPRALVESNNVALSIISIIFSAIAAAIFVGTTGVVIYKKKKKLLGRGSQIEFLLLLLSGLFMSSIV